MANALRVLPCAGDPDHATPGESASGMALILRAHLGPSERLYVASAAIESLDAETAEMLAETTLDDVRAGIPFPPFQGVRNEARHWAALASPGELRAYLAAAWQRLGEADRRAFIQDVHRFERPNRRAAA